jgi:proteasome accessory factor B
MVPGKRHERPSEDCAARLTAELDDLAARNIARVRAVPDSDADFRLTAKYGAVDSRGEISIPTADLDLLADELSEFASDIEVMAPEELRTRISGRFDVLSDSHGGPSSAHHPVGRPSAKRTHALRPPMSLPGCSPWCLF